MRSWPFLLLVALLGGCAHAPAPSAITKIVVSRNQCGVQCSFFQLTLSPNGDVEYTDGLALSVHGHLDARTYHDVVRYLVAVPAFGPQTNYLAYPGEEPSTTIWTSYSGTHRQVRFPTTNRFGGASTDVERLNRWAQFVSAVTGNAVARARQVAVKRLSRMDMLQRVIFESKGCFGTCPAYVATFNRDGSARLADVRYLVPYASGKARNLGAIVPFHKVTAMLQADGFATLKPRYPLKWVDVYGVSFQFDYRDGYSYTVQAPDRTQWPVQVAVLAGAFGQLVRDTNWAPTR